MHVCWTACRPCSSLNRCCHSWRLLACGSGSEGEVREYRKSRSQPTVQVAAVESPNSADWFDLHIKVAIDGEEVPFEDLFVGLTQGQDFLILETGVYFSLDDQSSPNCEL